MKIGLSTYSFYWHSISNDFNLQNILTLLEETNRYGIHLFQICDFGPLESFTDEELEQIAVKARQLNIELEVGTKGIEKNKLEKFLYICEKLNSKTLRTMLNSADFVPTIEEAIVLLQEVMPLFEEKGITIALETYEQRKTEDLVHVVKTVSSSNLGICLDPANCIANLEYPDDVMLLAAPFVKNLHLKDFKFERKEVWVGFSLIGTPFGKGLLNTKDLIRTLRRHHVNINAIVEFWLPFSSSIEETVMLEKEWIRESLDFIKENLMDQWRNYDEQFN